MCWYDSLFCFARSTGLLSSFPFIRLVGHACSFVLYQDTLTGQPVAEDTVMFAVPMCGPWTALQSFKYKVRVQAPVFFSSVAVATAYLFSAGETRARQREKG